MKSANPRQEVSGPTRRKRTDWIVDVELGSGARQNQIGFRPSWMSITKIYWGLRQIREVVNRRLGVERDSQSRAYLFRLLEQLSVVRYRLVRFVLRIEMHLIGIGWGGPPAPGPMRCRPVDFNEPKSSRK